ncbi:unnamed protein product [Moneuplotes crassus]|uniref:Uncharacterized protein n=1 Tax=Euplotes crassus TaxID=5936 RepID=A0AAD1UAH2_EUPCR|nr:unnamed protein product [Moneuplotes crassus]
MSFVGSNFCGFSFSCQTGISTCSIPKSFCCRRLCLYSFFCRSAGSIVWLEGFGALSLFREVGLSEDSLALEDSICCALLLEMLASRNYFLLVESSDLFHAFIGKIASFESTVSLCSFLMKGSGVSESEMALKVRDKSLLMFCLEAPLKVISSMLSQLGGCLEGDELESFSCSIKNPFTTCCGDECLTELDFRGSILPTLSYSIGNLKISGLKICLMFQTFSSILLEFCCKSLWRSLLNCFNRANSSFSILKSFDLSSIFSLSQLSCFASPFSLSFCVFSKFLRNPTISSVASGNLTTEGLMPC